VDDLSRTEPAATAPPPIDAVAPWLLRVGIDHSGRLDLTQLWDIAIRGAVLADLWLTGRISDGNETLQIDLELTGIRYLDAAVAELVDFGDTELDGSRPGGFARRTSPPTWSRAESGRVTGRSAPRGGGCIAAPRSSGMSRCASGSRTPTTARSHRRRRRRRP